MWATCRKLAESLAGKPASLLDYRLARKDVYVSSANLAAAFQRMLSEPRSKQRNSEKVHQFVVLNHILSSNIATLTATVLTRNQEATAPLGDGNRAIRRSLAALSAGLRKLEAPGPPERSPDALPLPDADAPRKALLDPEDHQLLEQLEFIQKVSGDISKVTEAMAA